MKFQVPQFIDVEDKIVGPLTLKQFIYLGGAAGIIIAIYRFTPLFISIPLIPIFAALGGALAFYRPNNKPFINMIESFSRYLVSSRLYVWQLRHKKTSEKEKLIRLKGSEKKAPTPAKAPTSKLSELSWDVDVKKTTNAPDDKTIGDKV